MFNEYLTETDIQIVQESQKALRKIKTSKNYQQKSLLETVQDNFSKYDKAAYLFEEYDIVDFEIKSNIDMLYYAQLFNKLEESEQLESVQKLLIELTKSVKDVYEITNLKPEVYGAGIDYKILEESNEIVRNKLSKKIFEYLDSNFYRLDPEKRKKKYFNESVEISKKLITEGVETEEAIEYSVKVVVMENLLRKIAFPFSIWGRITNLMESEIYSKVFDRDRLIETVERAEKNIKAVAKVVAAAV